MTYYEPTLSEIRLACLAYQSTWSEDEERQRRRGHQPEEDELRKDSEAFRFRLRRWSHEDDELLLTASIDEASARMGRSLDACRVRLIRIKARMAQIADERRAA